MTGLESLFQRYRYLLFFDTETTGLHPEENDRITELAMVRIGPEDARVTLEKPSPFLGPQAAHL